MPWTEDWSVEKDSKRVTFAFRGATGDAEKDCSTALAQFLQEVREKKVFGVLDGWRNELYPIYGPNRQLLFSIERSATNLFGVVTYGVHLTAFVRTLDGMKLWIPRRAKTKQTYPGMMDNTVAGGLSMGEQPFQCLVREAAEEASLPEHVTRKARPCGTLTYFQIRDVRAGGETGLCQPECQYLYDLELPLDVIPKPCDNEAVDFRLLSIEEVQKAMGKGEFKPNCALVVLEFLVRHGILTAENEPDYVEIVARLHRRLEFPTA
jgi:8-oxo-dGTP pyrophosphatase MutT (NUDIX family)